MSLGGSAAPKRFWRFLVRVYASADPRSLALFRIVLGCLLFRDVWRRIPDLDAHYANTGWLTNHYALYQPMSDHFFSLYTAFSTPGEVSALFAVHLLVSFFLIVGWHTRLMQVLSAVLITSLNSRTILVENGGWVVLNLLCVWSMFLPCGRRFSVDAFLASWRNSKDFGPAALNDPHFFARPTQPVVSLAVTALILQWGVIYYFNVVHKQGLPWKDGTAVYYFLQQDRMITAFGALVRRFVPLGVIKVLTWSTLGIESAIALLVLCPFKSHVTRMIAWALSCSLHLSIEALVQLGPFSWAMITMFVALIPAQFWDALERRARAKKPRRTLVYDASDGASIAFCRVIRRLDTYGLVNYEPLAPVDQRAPSRAAELRADAEQTLIVSGPRGEPVWRGARALSNLWAALPLSPLGRFWVLPGVRTLSDAALARLVRHRARFTSWLELTAWPRSSDEPAQLETPLTAFLRRLRGAAAFVVIALILIAETSQVLLENHALPAAFIPEKRPAWIEAVVIYPRLFQGWSMFAPAPPNDDGRVVVDGRTVDGRKLDPLTGLEPSFDVRPADGYKMNQIWGDFHRRIAEPRFSGYWDGFRQYLLHQHEISGRAEDALVAFDVWYIWEIIPPPGLPTQAPERRKLFSYGFVQP